MEKKIRSPNAKMIIMKLHKINDEDILKRLDFVGNKQGYIKRLIREDIKRNESEEHT